MATKGPKNTQKSGEGAAPGSFLFFLSHFDQLSSRRPEFQKVLHHWYRVHQRKLPWRETPSLYKTVVSEFMLQQTQVTTVLPYFARWLQALPDFRALALAPESQVMKLWEGLGYYSRARNLHKLAQSIATRPIPPRTPAEWQELPGIGPYTAAAITSISFAEPAACVDGNVVRILARLTSEGRIFRDSSSAAKHFSPLAAVLIVGSDPGTHNQAMMELGATVCLRRNPRCSHCPVAPLCAGRALGHPEDFPRLQPKKIEKQSVTRLWYVRAGNLLLKRGAAGARRLAGVHELPAAADLALENLNPKSLLAIKRRAITRFQITESIFRVKPTAALDRKIASNRSLEWVPLAKLDSISLSGPHKRWIGEILRGP